jgi:assimilatory nitrate reductase catalytic subunit
MSDALSSVPFDLVAGETRRKWLLRAGTATPRFLQGVFPFVGRGLFELAPLDDSLAYVVPDGRAGNLVYFRAGNHADDLLYLAIAANGVPIRYFPIGPKSDFHVPLAIVEPHAAGTRLEVLFAAPRGLSGTLIVDAGILEVAQEQG